MTIADWGARIKLVFNKRLTFKATEITDDIKNNNFNITFSHNLDTVKLSWIFDVQYLIMSIEDSARKTFDW